MLVVLKIEHHLQYCGCDLQSQCLLTQHLPSMFHYRHINIIINIPLNDIHNQPYISLQEIHNHMPIFQHAYSSHYQGKLVHQSKISQSGHRLLSLYSLSDANHIHPLIHHTHPIQAWTCWAVLHTYLVTGEAYCKAWHSVSATCIMSVATKSDFA